MTVKITGEFIKLGQFLKKINRISSGGDAKWFVESSNIIINGEKPGGRSSKIFPGSTVWINDELYKVISENVE
ncbi:MAG: RNA-binding S4 domain-containing protein [Mollicutes bacterium PWAP]|nr:RNA-binding S4 domain-containing protein [Mollicutes bacterium PWAP]